MAARIAQIADDHKAQDIVVLNVHERSDLADYFVIASGANPRQLRAIADEIQREAKSVKARLLGAEGLPVSRWVLLDYADVIVHLFEPTTRTFYDLEMLWGDAPRVVWRRFKRVPLADLAPAATKPAAGGA